MSKERINIVDVEGNWYAAQQFVNKWGLADRLVTLSPSGGNFTLVVLRLTEEQERAMAAEGYGVWR